MPPVLRSGGFRLFFYSNEGSEPPHVHVEIGDGTAKFWLKPVEPAYCAGLKAPELRRARVLVEENRDMILGKWNEHFGAT